MCCACGAGGESRWRSDHPTKLIQPPTPLAHTILAPTHAILLCKHALCLFILALECPPPWRGFIACIFRSVRHIKSQFTVSPPPLFLPSVLLPIPTSSCLPQQSGGEDQIRILLLNKLTYLSHTPFSKSIFFLFFLSDPWLS